MRTRLITFLAALALVAACSKGDLFRQQRADQPLNDVAASGGPVASAAPMLQMATGRTLAAKDALMTGNEVSDLKKSVGPNVPNAAYAADSIAPTMIIRTGSASIEVDSLEVGVARVRELARRVGGYVANTSMQAGRNQTRAATLEIRLPASRYDEALTGLQPLGKVESVNVSAEDVGEEYVDVSARVTNSHRLEQRLIQVLETKTGKLRDVLDVERELARVREEIERMEGRLRYLRTKASVSTLSITVHEPYPVVGQRGSSSVIGEAFKQSWRNFVQFTARFIAAMGSIIPAIIVALAVAAGFLAILKKVTRKPKTKPE
jgi:hypothetical protein